ncbi:MAG: ATP synthase F1 subunit epsilon [Bacillota bacterium]
MAKKFNLIVLTPEREFYNGPAEELIVESLDGQIGVLADHTPMATALGVGMIRIKNDDRLFEAAHSEGFMEVRKDATVVLAQACEWPYEIDLGRAREAKERAERRMEEHKTAESIAKSRLALTRALTRIKLKAYENSSND